MLKNSASSLSCEAADTESLRAALSVFDDWDSEFTALFQLNEDTSFSSSASFGRQAKTSKATAPYKPRRDARRLEIAALRAQVDELETVVALERALITQQPPTLKDESVEAAALRNEWERMANNQQQERLAAEVENAKLRELLESQVKNAEQILKLTKRARELEKVLPVEPAAPSFDHYSGPKVDLPTQLRQLDAMLPRANELFASGAFSEKQWNCFQEVRFVDTAKESRGVGVQFEAAWLLPFEAQRVTDALWVHTVRPTFKHKKAAYLNIHEDASCLVSQFISTPVSKDVWGSQGQVAARRVPRDLGDDSFLILVTIQARAYAGSTRKGSASVEGWLRVESVLCEDKPITRVKWYRHTLLQPPEVETMRPSELNKWINAAISGTTRSKFERDLEWSVQALENMLVSPKPGA